MTQTMNISGLEMKNSKHDSSDLSHRRHEIEISHCQTQMCYTTLDMCC